MTLPIDDGCRIRVIRALLGMDSKSFALRIGVSAGTLTGWEKNRLTPRASNRQVLAKLCHEQKIAFMPSGMPVPAVDCLILKENINA